jgi:hypothetical protein
MDQCFVSEDVLENLSLPSQVGAVRVGGIDMNANRMRKVARALLALSAQPFGFSRAQLAAHVQGQHEYASPRYGPREAAYDLQKFRAKKIVGPFAASRRRYRVLPNGLTTLSAFMVLREKVMEPLLAATRSGFPLCVDGELTPLTRQKQLLPGNMRELLWHLGFAA